METHQDNYLYQEESYKIIGAALNVHKSLGCGFLEAVYGDALEIEFAQQGIAYEREKRINIEYKGYQLNHQYCADFVCFGKIIVELKALDQVNNQHYSQVINYLKASKMKLGILLNFGEVTLKPKRIIY
ncbi:MAG: GxxExxY protein [Prevotella sp.]|nr:GxxExxY protein [Prevotella sp.]